MRKPPALRSVDIDRDIQALDAFVCDHPVKLVHGCAHAFLLSFPFSGRDPIYSGPPYLQVTRRSARRYCFDSTDADPVVFPDLLKRYPIR